VRKVLNVQQVKNLRKCARWVTTKINLDRMIVLNVLRVSIVQWCLLLILTVPLVLFKKNHALKVSIAQME